MISAIVAFRRFLLFQFFNMPTSWNKELNSSTFRRIAQISPTTATQTQGGLPAHESF